MSKTIAIVLGSVRPGRAAVRVAKFITVQVEKKLKQQGYQPVWVDPLELNLPLLQTKFEYMKETDDKYSKLKQVSSVFKQASAVILLTPEYNHSASPALTNLLNYFWHDEYDYKPVGLVTYSGGGFGGVRALIGLRAYVAELGFISIPRSFPISRVYKTLTDQGELQEGLSAQEKETILEGSDCFLNELGWYAEALDQARKQGEPNADEE